MVLAADPLHALEPVRRGGHRARDVAAFELQRLGDEGVVGGDRLGDVGDVRQGLVLDLGERRGAAGGVAGLGDDREDRLAVELDGPLAKTGSSCLPIGLTSLCGMSATVSTADHAGRGADRVEVDRDDLGVGLVGKAEVGVQGADRLGDVVGVLGEAGDVLVRRVVALLGVDAAADGLGEVNGVGHQMATSRVSWAVSPVDSR